MTKLTSSQKLREAGIAYILQDKSIFPGMTVEENLWMGGYLISTPGWRNAANTERAYCPEEGAACLKFPAHL